MHWMLANRQFEPLVVFSIWQCGRVMTRHSAFRSFKERRSFLGCSRSRGADVLVTPSVSNVSNSVANTLLGCC